MNPVVGRAKASDIALALFVVAIAGLLLIPLPALFLDLLLAVNISFSLVLLLVALYMRNALALLAFPSILLLSTLFRLGLNVASTRLILADGYAGQVIEAFGTFLIRGDVVVGLIIFAIITVVNFIVVSRGSIRVSEVAARFALDAMPGKQMAIESDLRAGLIGTHEASRRREELKRESQLYGAMDGAMKFVQGDVIAGIFIIFVNIVGGMYLGVSSGLSFGEALQTYTILTIGDGLVSQIPALLVSICAGIIVTRVSSGENTTLGSDVGEQILSRPAALVFAGLLLMFFGLIPGLPAGAFISVGGLTAGLGLLRARARSANFEQGSSGVQLVGLPALTGPSADREREVLVSDRQARLFLDPVLARIFRQQHAEFERWWQQFRIDYRNDVGLVLPEFVVEEDANAAPGSVTAELRDLTLFRSQIVADALYLAMRPGEAEALGFEVLRDGAHPRTGYSGFWAPATSFTRRAVSAYGLEALDGFQYAALEIAAFFERFPEEILGLADVHQQLKELEESAPGLVGEALGTAFINASRLTEIMQELVREGIGVRDFRRIVELTSLYCSSFGVALDKDDAFDLGDVVSFIRRRRSRTTIGRLTGDRKALRVLTLGPDTDAWFEAFDPDAHPGAGSEDQLQFERWRRQFHSASSAMRERGLDPLVILCRAAIRHKVSRFIRVCRDSAHVMSSEEVDSSVRVESVGTWG